MSPEEFHAYWRDHHGPLVASTASGSHVIRYVQHHRALQDYSGDHDPGYDGVTEQWFASMDEYRAHIAEPDFSTRLIKRTCGRVTEASFISVNAAPERCDTRSTRRRSASPARLGSALARSRRNDGLRQIA